MTIRHIPVAQRHQTTLMTKVMMLAMSRDWRMVGMGIAMDTTMTILLITMTTMRRNTRRGMKRGMMKDITKGKVNMKKSKKRSKKRKTGSLLFKASLAIT